MIVEPAASSAVRPEELRGALTLLTEPSPGAVIPLERDEFVVGRAPDVDLSIDDVGLSRSHVRFFRVKDRYFVEDLRSTNGTSINGVRIQGTTLLSDGARIQLGKSTILRFSLQDRLEQEAARALYEQTVRDALTGLHNRRYMEDRLASEFAFATRHKTHLALVVLDVDFFKRVNDTHGHQAGDAVLSALGKRLKGSVPEEDLVARYGGEEFVIASRSTTRDGVLALAEEIRASISRQPIVHGKVRLELTLSAGVASMVDNEYKSPSAMMAAADRALYQAKKNGRNQVVLAQ